MGWRPLGVFSDLDFPLLGQLLNSSCLLLKLSTALALGCAVLVSRRQNKDVCIREVQPYLHLVSHFCNILFFLTLLLQIVLGWLYKYLAISV